MRSTTLKDLPPAWRAHAEAQLGKAVREKPAIRARRGTMNKTEQAFADHVLSHRMRIGEVASWFFEPIKIKIGNGAWYCPDFVCVMPDGSIEVYEIKGHKYAAGIVRVKTAAMLWPTWRFTLVMRGKAGEAWSYTRVA